MILIFYERNGLICARKNGITREREEGNVQIGVNKGFKIESLHDKQISSLRKTSAREFERYMYDTVYRMKGIITHGTVHT
jgi:hypothetical protein